MRVACVDLPAFPLQLVWRREPAWHALPVVVIDHDRPQGQVLWAGERARAAGVLVGQRYAYALALCSELRACVVPGEEIEAATAELRAMLHRLSPRVESGEPGTFWLDGEGLDRVFPDVRAPDPNRSAAERSEARLAIASREGPPLRSPPGSAWGMAIAQALADLGYRGAVVVGFSRFATYAIARATRLGVTVLRSDADEREMASQVPLARLDVQPVLRDALGRLGVTRVGELVRLPSGGILERFGREAHRLYELAAGERWDPLVPQAPPEAFDERVVFDDDEDNVERLVFASKAPIERLLDRLAGQGRALTALHLELSLKHAVGRISLRTEQIQPAAPSLDGRALLRLVHLRLTGAPPEAPVNAVRVWADATAATRKQLALFAQKPRRDLRAADEAVARLRAELGNDAVVHPVLRDGHLPEASFGWQRLVRLVAANPEQRAVRPLIRRVLARPKQLPIQTRLGRDDGWLLSGLEQGAVLRILGPYVVSGGWWTHELYREYHFAELRRGDCLWVYYDRNRRRWFWQGSVE
jgi:protein ImuB